MCRSAQITFSIVSHGHGRYIDALLDDLASLALPSFDIVLTLNIEEDEQFLARHSDLPLRIVRNSTAKGFGENHNHAFRMSTGRFFAVVNPDVRLIGCRLDLLLSLASDDRTGVCAPAVYSSLGELQDSARRYPTILRLARRKLRRHNGPDYEFGDVPREVDWVAGMFMIFRQEVFADIGGFDERFFMYFEDVDICRRISEAGWSVMLHPLARIIHDAQRASRRNLRHVGWHLISAVRYLIAR